MRIFIRRCIVRFCARFRVSAKVNIMVNPKFSRVVSSLG